MSNLNNIAGWRERIFASLLTVVLVVGVISTAVVIPFLIQNGMWQVALADGLALAWMFGIWRLKRLSYATRV